MGKHLWDEEICIDFGGMHSVAFGLIGDIGIRTK